MSRLDDLSSFPELEGHIPCIRCKGESSKTLVGGHWKCSVCAHVFNQDGSDIKIECHCDVCREERKVLAAAEAAALGETEEAPKKTRLEAVLDNVKKAVKGISKKKKKQE
jgi:hypothetical protein